MGKNSINNEFLRAIIESIPAEIVVIDNNHKIFLTNKFARKKYSNSSIKLREENSIFACHKKEKSHRIIQNAYNELKKGKDKVFIYDSDETGKAVYLIAVRDAEKNVVGYYEWFE
jgi:PAS domain S-box-containing protein